jgi:murein L,D-transpeptidase YcbB/YkuD
LGSACNLPPFVALAAALIEEILVRAGLRTTLAIGVLIALGGCDQLRRLTGHKSAEVSAPQAAVWTAATARQLREALASRAAHGLDRLPMETGGTPGTADGDSALTRTALAYARALAAGASDPTKLYDIYTIPRPHPDLKRGLTLALQKRDVRGWLEGLAPQDDNYRRLSRAYLAIVQHASAPAPVIPDAGKEIRPGSADPRIPLIARQLAALGYLDARFADQHRYSVKMVAAVRALQADYGINPDGLIGPAALAILNTTDEDRARALAVAMERLRWLDRSPPPTRIDVNLAAAKLTYWRDGKIADSRKVVVGEPDKETPQLEAPIYRLVANPTWTVPRSVQEAELAGQSEEQLQAQRMAWKDGWIVQESGPKNSLGLVKFDMADDQAIYLHDTPAKALFGLVQRQRSHGCVRVEDALGFAAMLAADEGVDADWRAAQATGEETFVKLPRGIKVRLLYQTILFDDDGEPVIRDDPYDWNERVAEALGFAKSNSMALKASRTDVGP